MSEAGYLKGLMGALITLTIFYAVALLVVLPILLMIGLYIISLFGNELFTQDIYSIFPGMFFIVISGIIDLIWVIGMIGIRAGLKHSLKSTAEKEFSRLEIIIYSIIPLMIAISFVVIGFLITEEFDSLYTLSIGAGILLAFVFLKWKVIDIPAKALCFMKNEKSLRWSRISAIPLVIFIFSIIPLLITLGMDDIPTETILLVYLEVLFALSIIINLFSIGGVVSEIGVQIKRQNRLTEPNGQISADK